MGSRLSLRQRQNQMLLSGWRFRVCPVCEWSSSTLTSRSTSNEPAPLEHTMFSSCLAMRNSETGSACNRYNVKVTLSSLTRMSMSLSMSLSVSVSGVRRQTSTVIDTVHDNVNANVNISAPGVFQSSYKTGLANGASHPMRHFLMASNRQYLDQTKAPSIHK